VAEGRGGSTDHSFGARIQQLRRDHGMTQRQVAAELGIDFTYLSKLENDRGEPPGEETVRRLAQLFGIDAEELLAKAGKIPTELRERAQGDVQFATLLRTLPKLSQDELQRVYRSAGIPGGRRRRRA
jgi:HTH-type transcriptional regulator, competence development regulator